jgi:putative ABC transport system substrate-binding protein
MYKCIVGSTILVMLLVSHGLRVSDAQASERQRRIRIGALSESWGPTPWTTGLRDGLLALGYQENEDFVLGVRFTQGNLTELPTAAQELVQLEADIIVVAGETPSKAAQRATTRVPIVFTSVEAPVKSGLVQSFARPGGNTTGVASLTLELSPKRLEIFRELVPGLKRVLYPYDATDAPSIAQGKAYRDAARRLGITLMEKPMRTEAEAEATLAQVRQGEVDGILPPTPSVSLNIPGFALEAASQRGIPILFDAAFWVERGALASYGPDFYEGGRQAARIVDKIIKGADPAEIPVEVNSKIEFAINLKTAKALGLSIAPEVLFRADKVIR